MNKISLYLQVAFYLLAGLNHFRDPGFYYPLIPAYLPYTESINAVSGVAEILLALLLLNTNTRRLGSLGIVAMLIAFIPSHLYFIEIGGCSDGGLCTPLWVAWVRLIVVHPILIWWAWNHRHAIKTAPVG